MNVIAEKHSPQIQQPALSASMPPALLESLTTLIQRVFLSINGAAVRTVVVTSAQPGSGVSYISSCLATLLAGFGSTLLLDGHALFSLAHRRVVPALTDCTSIKQSQLSVFGKAEAEEIAHNTKTKGENVLSEIDALFLEFDYVIVDAPALSVSKAAPTVSIHADGVLLVVVPNETEIADVCAARKKLEAVGSRLLGAIYNTILDHSGTTGYTPCNV